jgi:hypothetical protein
MAAVKEPPRDSRSPRSKAVRLVFLVKPFDLIDLVRTGRFHTRGAKMWAVFAKKTFHSVSNYLKMRSG